MNEKLVFTDEKRGHKYLVQTTKVNSTELQRCLQCFRYTHIVAKNVSWMCDDIRRQLGPCNKGINGPIYFKLLKFKIIKP